LLEVSPLIKLHKLRAFIHYSFKDKTAIRAGIVSSDILRSPSSICSPGISARQTGQILDFTIFFSTIVIRRKYL